MSSSSEESACSINGNSNEETTSSSEDTSSSDDTSSSSSEETTSSEETSSSSSSEEKEKSKKEKSKKEEKKKSKKEEKGKSKKEEKSRVIFVKSEEQYQPVKSVPNRLVVVKYSAGFCAPCKSISSYYKDLSNSHPNASFMEVDIEKFRKLPDVATVRSIPTFKFFKNGVELTSFSGASKDKLSGHIAKFYS